jgi:uncharacterized protein (UPF0303 family)
MPSELDPQSDLSRIALQEQTLVYPSFDEHSAWSLGARNLSVVIDIRKPNQQLFYTALPGTTADNPDWVRRKSNLTLRFHRSSYAIGLETRAKNSTLFDRYALPVTDYADHGGSFPIRVHGAGVIAAVTVSGLPQRADHELAVEALCLELGRDPAALRLDIHPA